MISRTEARTTKQQASEESAVVQSGEGDVRSTRPGPLQAACETVTESSGSARSSSPSYSLQ